MINVYSANTVNFNNNGLATLIPTSCEFSPSINSGWQLSLTHPFDEEKRYQYLVKDNLLRVTDMLCISEWVSSSQLFRIYDVKKSMYDISIIAFPVGMEATYDAPIQELRVDGGSGNAITGQAAASAINTYIRSVTNDKYTVTSNVTSSHRKAYPYKNTNLIAAISGSEDKSFVNLWGGEVIYDNYDIKINNKIGDQNNASIYPIRYGRNLMGLSHEMDMSSVITRIYPISADDLRLNAWTDITDRSGLSTTPYKDSGNISNYPYIHAAFIENEYELIDTNTESKSRTAQQTEVWRTNIVNATKGYATTLWNRILGELRNQYAPEFIQSIIDGEDGIVKFLQNLIVFTHEGWQSFVKSAVKEGVEWIKDVQLSEWEWRGNWNDGWWYGSSNTNYAQDEYVLIGREWNYFDQDGWWIESSVESDEKWGWWQPKGQSRKKYGNFENYYAKNEWIYKTVSGVLTCYWINEGGWYEDQYTEASSWDWHETGDGKWWFGAEGASSDDMDSYAHDIWVYIDGYRYFFDADGYYHSGTSVECDWDWVTSDNIWWWFGVDDKEYGATYLKNQSVQIEGEWYQFDSQGLATPTKQYIRNAASWFATTIYNQLIETLQTNLKAAYTLLYQLMIEWCQKRYDNGLDMPTVNVKADLIDLSKTTEYEDFENLEEIHLGDKVRVIDNSGNQYDERIVALTYDCLRHYNTKVEVGQLSKSVSQMLNVSYQGNDSGTKLIAGDNVTIDGRVISVGDYIGRLVGLLDFKVNDISVVSGNLGALGIEAGQNVSVDQNGNRLVISAEGGGGLEYWEETSQRFYRDYKVEGISADEGFKKTEWIQEHYSSYTTSEGLLYRKKGSAPVIAGEVGDGTLQSDCRRIVMASTNAEDLDWEWAHCNPASAHLTPTSEWFDKEDYPLVPSQYSAYGFGWQTATITYNNVTWYIMAIQPMYGDGYHHLTNGTLEVKHAGTGAMQMTCAELGQFLLEQVHASDKVDAQVSIGVNDNVFQWIVDGEEVAWINEDGTSSFDREEIKEVVPLTLEEYNDLPSSKLTDDKAYFVTGSGRVLDPNYTYHTYGSDENIVVRVYHEGENDEEIVWFFHNFKTNNDKGTGRQAFPAELAQYFTTGSANQSAKMYDTGTQTVLGWIVLGDYLGGTINEYSSDYSIVNAWVVDAKVVMGNGTEQNTSYEDPYVWIELTERMIIVNGVNYIPASGGGGTEVEANPSGTATDILNTIGIDGTIYALPSGGGGGQEKITDLIATASAWHVYKEYSMDVTWSSNYINFIWNGGASIGGNIVKVIPIPANATKIRFNIVTQTAYDATIERFKLGIGVRTTYDTGVILDGYNVSDWLAFKNYTQTNSIWEDELDLSSITVDTYLYIIGHGWNAEVTQLDLVEIVEIESQEKVKGLTQAEYDALPSSKNSDGVAYFVDDSGTYKIMFNGHNYSGT